MPDMIFVEYGRRRAGWIQLAARARGMSVDEYTAELLRIAGEAMNERIAADRKLARLILTRRGAGR